MVSRLDDEYFSQMGVLLKGDQLWTSTDVDAGCMEYHVESGVAIFIT